MDNSRLAKLGEAVLSTAVTLALFKRQPFLSGEEIKVGTICSYRDGVWRAQYGRFQDQAQRITNGDVIQGWVKSYQMASRIMCLAEFVPKREEPEVSGAFCCDCGTTVD
jgi:hypothetical protein